MMKVSGLASFRKKLPTEGVSEQAAMLTTNARRPVSNSNYE